MEPTSEINIRVALLEQGQAHHKELMDKILDLAETTKELLVEQARRVDSQDNKAVNIAAELKEHRAEDTAFHTEVRESLKEFVEEQKQFNIQLTKDFKESLSAMDKRVKWLEKWWYVISGGAMVVAFIGKELWDKFVH